MMVVFVILSREVKNLKILRHLVPQDDNKCLKVSTNGHPTQYFLGRVCSGHNERQLRI